MPQQYAIEPVSARNARINRAAGRLCTFVMGAIASFVLTLSAYSEDFRPSHVAAVLVVLIALHLLWHSRFFWQRELTLYFCFVLYMYVALLWTNDWTLAMNTLVPATNCVLVMIFFGSLIAYHHIPTAIFGSLCGFAAGAAFYTLTQGFPFSYPDQFTYNAIALMYLFGLFLTLMFMCFRRSHILLLAVAAVIMLHIVATTSIKVNLGIALGFVGGGLVYFRHYGRVLRRRIIVLTALVCCIGFAVASNDALVDMLDRGVQRVTIGLNVLQAREDVSGYSGFGERDYWKEMGIGGWKQNPIFGYGTEAFRDAYGITSHSTPIDLLYNFGLIGLILFYSVLASLAWRLLLVDSARLSGPRSLMFAGVICYAFASLSGTLHYNGSLCAFVGISAALLTSERTTAALAKASRRRGTPHP
jgi:hypothetical protein